MIILAPVALAFLLSLLFNGSFRRLGEVRLRASYLILLALGLQVLLFTPWWSGAVASAGLSESLYILSMLLLIVATWLNRRVPGIIPLALGLLLNTIMIAANGGRMPASLEALRAAGRADSAEAVQGTNSVVMDETTYLWFLGDVFAMPRWVPLANVFSVGDLLVAVGGVWFVWANMRDPSHPR